MMWIIFLFLHRHYILGSQAKEAIDKARSQVADMLGASTQGIAFASNLYSMNVLISLPLTHVLLDATYRNPVHIRWHRVEPHGAAHAGALSRRALLEGRRSQRASASSVGRRAASAACGEQLARAPVDTARARAPVSRAAPRVHSSATRSRHRRPRAAQRARRCAMFVATCTQSNPPSFLLVCVVTRYSLI